MFSTFSKWMMVSALALGTGLAPVPAFAGGSHQAVKVQVRVQVRVVPVKSGCGKSSCRKPSCGGGCRSYRPKSCSVMKSCKPCRRGVMRRAFRNSMRRRCM